MDSKISYCLVCKNKGYSNEVGTFCNITNEKPVFELQCPNYKYDFNEHEKLKDLKRKIFKTNTFKNSNILYTDNSQERETYEETKLNPFYKAKKLINIPEKVEIRNSYISKILCSILMFIFAMILLIFDPYNYKVSNEVFYYILILIFITVALVFFIQFKDKRPKIILTKEGIFIWQNKFISWQNICLTLIKKKKEENVMFSLILILNNSSDIIEYSIENVHISLNELENYIELYKKDYWNRQL